MRQMGVCLVMGLLSPWIVIEGIACLWTVNLTLVVATDLPRPLGLLGVVDPTLSNENIIINFVNGPTP